MNRRMVFTMALVSIVAGTLTSCATVHQKVLCGPNDQPQRWDDAQIDRMSDKQAKQELARNEELVRRGCAVPNT